MRACVRARVRVYLYVLCLCLFVGVCAMVHVCHDKSQSTTFLKLGVFFFPSNLVFGRASLVRFVTILDITG